MSQNNPRLHNFKGAHTQPLLAEATHNGAGPLSHNSKKAFRYWIDFQVLSSPESTTLLERALQLVGGVRTGGPPKLHPATAKVQKLKDYVGAVVLRVATACLLHIFYHVVHTM